MKKTKILIVGAGINGLVAANYLQKSGADVTLIDQSERVGGACISEQAQINGEDFNYALGASVLGLMQDFIYKETGLSSVLDTFVPSHPKLVHFPGETHPAMIYRDASELDKELSKKWGETGDLRAFREDENKVIQYLQKGYKEAIPPSISSARNILGKELTKLWITGTARDLLNHYLTSDKSKMYMAMTVSESGPVSLDEPYSAFTLPVMDSGSVFNGYYGFVKGGIWKLTEKLGEINRKLGVKIHTSSKLLEVDSKKNTAILESPEGTTNLGYDVVIFATDPMTALNMMDSKELPKMQTEKKYIGSSGKLNVVFKNPIQWRDATTMPDTEAAFRFLFSVNSIEKFEESTISVLDKDKDYVPGYMQIYCEGGAMRIMNYSEPYDRIAVFMKNFSLNNKGEDLQSVKEDALQTLFQYIRNPEDCIWTRLLTPKDLQETFHFPGGNIDHTVLTGGQTFFDRNFSSDPENHFYRLLDNENAFICGAGTYPCGSIAGTPGYMCSQEVIKYINS
jgi:phytoene dehydrogenase-like protein